MLAPELSDTEEITVSFDEPTDLLQYLTTDAYEVTITGRHGSQSYTLSYHGNQPAQQHSNTDAIWGLTLIIDKHVKANFWNKSVRGDCVQSRKVTRMVAPGSIIEIGEHTVYVDALSITRVQQD